MASIRCGLRILSLVIPFILIFPEEAEAQERPQPQISWHVGLARFDLVETGVAPVAAARLMMPLASVLALEGGVLAARTRQRGVSTLLLIPEAQAQLLLPFTGFVPYMGLGAGSALDFRGSELGGMAAALTISGSLGFRAAFAQRFGLQGEVRGRGIGVDFEDSSLEFALGASFPL